MEFNFYNHTSFYSHQKNQFRQNDTSFAIFHANLRDYSAILHNSKKIIFNFLKIIVNLFNFPDSNIIKGVLNENKNSDNFEKETESNET